MSNIQYHTPEPTMRPYWERAAWLKFHVFDLFQPLSTPTRHLSGTERATVRVVAPRLEDLPEGNSLLHEAQYRLALMQHLRLLTSNSGHDLAATFQRLMWPEHPASLHRRGWEILRKLDEENMVEVWVSAEATRENPLPRRTMRLHERCLELMR